MRVLLIAVLLLLAAGLTFLLIQYLTFKRGVHHDRLSRIDGQTVKTKLHFAHRIPRWLKVRGFSLGEEIWMYFSYVDARRRDVAHEFGHRILSHVIGVVRYKLLVAWEWATQWVWRRRGTEEEARRVAEILGKSTTGIETVTIRGKPVQVEAPWLLEFRQ